MLAGIGLYSAIGNGSSWHKLNEASGCGALSIVVKEGHCYLFEKIAHTKTIAQHIYSDVTDIKEGKATLKYTKNKTVNKAPQCVMKGWFKKKEP